MRKQTWIKQGPSQQGRTNHQGHTKQGYLGSYVFLALPMNVPVMSRLSLFYPWCPCFVPAVPVLSLHFSVRSMLVPVFSLLSLFCPFCPCFVPASPCFVVTCPCLVPACPCLVPANRCFVPGHYGHNWFFAFFLTCDMWHFRCDTCHVTCDIRHMVWGEHFLKISAPVSQSVSNRSVCRTALATPGLLTMT